MLALATAAAAAPAVAQTGPRQSMSFGFGSQQPGSPSSLSLAIDYVNPSDPAAKPYAVQTVIEELAPGARFDTSVPERCTASDQELTARGAAACPAGSRVGGGELDLDTGGAGPGRIIENEVTQLNAADQLILLLEQPNGSRAVSRSPIEDGRRIVAQVPPIPGGPPDGFTAIRRVRVTLDEISVVRDGRRVGYVTTPPACPASRVWTSTIEFRYRDGVSQRADSGSPCTPAAAARSHPVVRVAGVPARCTRRGFRARVGVHSHVALRRVRVSLDGRRLRTTARRRFGVSVRLRGQRHAVHRLKVVARDRAGKKQARTIRFRSCA